MILLIEMILMSWDRINFHQLNQMNQSSDNGRGNIGITTEAIEK